MAKIITVMIFITLISVVFQFIMIKRGNEQGKYLSTLLRKLENEEDFFDYADVAIANEKNPEFKEKIRLMKVWGEAYHHRFDQFEKDIKEIDLKKFVTNGKKSRVMDNEDAFFYLFLLMPNLLYGNNRMDLVDELLEINMTVENDVNNLLCWQMYMANMRYYKREGDMGGALYGDILSGDYAQYKYGKQLIGVYKSITSAMLAAVYKELNDHKRYSELEDDLEFFAGMALGVRWLKELGLPIPKGASVPEKN